MDAEQRDLDADPSADPPADPPAGRPSADRPTLPGWVGPAAAAVLLGVSALSLLSLRPPAPRPSSAPDTAFSAERAMVHLERIARAPRPVGSAAHDSVRSYLASELTGLGLEVRIDTVTWVPATSSWVRAVSLTNIVARLPGADPTGTLALVSHYDSEIGAPGAGDAGAAVAAILEAVRALRAGPPLRNDLVVLLTDGEELGLLGARAFLAGDTTADAVDVVLNFEGRGTRGLALMFETGPGNGPLVRAFAGADPAAAGSSLFPAAYEYLPNRTDFTAFLAAGRTGLNFAHADGADAYHMPFDAPDRLDPGTLQHHGVHAVSLGRALGDADLTRLEGDDVTYFNVAGAGLVVYPDSAVSALALVAALLLLALLVWGMVRGSVTLWGFLVGAVATLPVIGISALIGWWTWRAAAAVHAEAGTLIGQRVYGEGIYMWALALAVAGITVGAYQLLRRWFNAASLALGALFLLVGLSLAAAIDARGAAYLLTWPALMGLAATALLVFRGDAPLQRRDAIVLTALAVPPLLLWAPHLHLFLVGLSIMFAALFGLLVVGATVAVLPLLDVLGRPNRWWLPAAAVAAAVALLGVGLVTAATGPERPLAANLVYLLDRDTGEASWASPHLEPDPWLDRFFQDPLPDMQIADYVPIYGRRTYRSGRAPRLELAATQLTAAPSSAGGDRVRLEVRPADGALGVLITPADTGWVPTRLEGQELLVHPAIWRLELWDTPADGAWTIELMAPNPDRAGALSLVTVVPGLPNVDQTGLPRPPGRTGTGVLGNRAAFTDLTLIRSTWKR